MLPESGEGGVSNATNPGGLVQPEVTTSLLPASCRCDVIRFRLLHRMGVVQEPILLRLRAVSFLAVILKTQNDCSMLP